MTKPKDIYEILVWALEIAAALAIAFVIICGYLFFFGKGF